MWSDLPDNIKDVYTFRVARHRVKSVPRLLELAHYFVEKRFPRLDLARHVAPPSHFEDAGDLMKAGTELGRKVYFILGVTFPEVPSLKSHPNRVFTSSTRVWRERDGYPAAFDVTTYALVKAKASRIVMGLPFAPLDVFEVIGLLQCAFDGDAFAPLSHHVVGEVVAELFMSLKVERFTSLYRLDLGKLNFCKEYGVNLEYPEDADLIGHYVFRMAGKFHAAADQAIAENLQLAEYLNPS